MFSGKRTGLAQVGEKGIGKGQRAKGKARQERQGLGSFVLRTNIAGGRGEGVTY